MPWARSSAGVILSHIDLASAVEARKQAARRYVTKAMREVEFHEPVFLGDIVSFYTETVRVGRTSITVRVSVEAERWGAGRGEKVKVTEAEVVLVAVDESGKADPDRRRRARVSAETVTGAPGRRTVKVICPHDCPDTCVMTVDVEDGRAVTSAATPTIASRRASCARR